MVVWYRNPLVSSEQMKTRMEGRKMIKIRNVSSKMKNGDFDSDWVTIGVVVDKLPPRSVYMTIVIVCDVHNE